MTFKKFLKHFILLALIVTCLILFYCTMGCFVIWTYQPRFISEFDTSRSLGFVIEGCFYAGFFILSIILTILYLIFFYKRPKKKQEKLQKQLIDAIEREQSIEKHEELL